MKVEKYFIRGSFINGGSLITDNNGVSKNNFQDGSLDITLGTPNQYFGLYCSDDVGVCSGNSEYKCRQGICNCFGNGCYSLKTNIAINC